MSKIRCFIGDHKTFENFTGTLIIRFMETLIIRFMETLIIRLYGDFTGDFVHKTFEDFL